MSAVGTESGRRNISNQRTSEEKEFGAHQWRHRINPREAVDIDKVISPVAEEIISRLDKGEIEFSVNVGVHFKSLHFKELRDVFWTKGYNITMVNSSDLSKGITVLAAEPVLSYKSLASKSKNVAVVVIENVPAFIIAYALLKSFGVI
jgi:hypothetical protein